MKENLLILASLLFMTVLCAYSFMGVSQSNIKSINGVAIANIGKIVEQQHLMTLQTKAQNIHPVYR
jgi:hypothetical protein